MRARNLFDSSSKARVTKGLGLVKNSSKAAFGRGTGDNNGSYQLQSGEGQIMEKTKPKPLTDNAEYNIMMSKETNETLNRVK
jgi:hypothetical protein